MAQRPNNSTRPMPKDSKLERCLFQSDEDFQDNWNVSYMKALKDFQDNWNMSYMKSFQDNLECLIHERLEGFSGPSGHFVYEIATLRCMFVSSDIDSVARDY